jgi:hypothetical protein
MSVADKLKALLQKKQNDNMKTGEEFLAENAKKEGSSILTKRFAI